MSEDARRILELLASGKVTVDEADELLKAIGVAPAGAGQEATSTGGKPAARHLRVAVTRADGDGRQERQVNIRVPLSLVRAGMRLGAMIPGYGEAISERLRQRGIDLDPSRIGAADLEGVFREMGEVVLDVDGGRAQVRVTCE